MGRWSHLDSDEERLPWGMKRIGYDSDTQTYTYRDSDGSLWEGTSGSQYGTLRRVGGGSRAAPAPPPPPPPARVTIDEQPYVLYDEDEDEDDFEEGDSGIAYGSHEKTQGGSPATPGKAKLQHLSKHPAGKTADNACMPSSSGSEHRSRSQSSGLKRSSTLSRIAGFFSPSKSKTSSSSRPPRRATTAISRSDISAPQRIRPARTFETFEEILGEAPRKSKYD
jgi:hypothetical protein